MTKDAQKESSVTDKAIRSETTESTANEVYKWKMSTFLNRRNKNDETL